MAKLKGPMFSLGASGKIAGALVYFGWKGLNVAREYVIPTNPRSAAQTTQRGYLTAAVAKIHEAQARANYPLDEDDQTAYALLGATFPTPRTWFNTIVKLWIDCKVASDVPCIYSDGKVNTSTVTGIELAARLNEETASQLAAGKFYLGKSKTNLIHSYTATVVAGDNVSLPAQDISDWAAVGDKIFWQFRPDVGDPCEGADSGIYTFKAT